MKSLLEVRPMFHWNRARINGHICMCFMALAMLRNIELRLQKAKHNWPENRIVSTLDKMQVSKITQNNNSYYLRSKLSEDQQVLSSVFKLRKVKPLTPKMLKIK